MEVFYTTLILTFLLALSSRLFGKISKINEVVFIFIVIIIFILVSGLRNNIGDTGAYMHSYSLLGEFTGFKPTTKDKGFTMFQLILYNINSDPQFLIVVTSLITQFLNMYTLAMYRNYYELQVYMYFTSGYFLVTMNGIRQSMVAAILFSVTHLIEKGKFIPYLLIVLFISNMHASALIMIPVYFIVRQEAWSRETKIVIVLASIGFLFFYQLMPHIFDALGESSYAEYEDSMMNGGGGSSFMRVIVNSVPVILAYIKRDLLKEKWKDSNIFVNMSLINLIIVTFGLYNWIFVRFSIYFQLYNFVLLPYLIKNCIENRKEKDLIYFCFIVCYFIFFYYEQVIGKTGMGYKSNFF